MSCESARRSTFRSKFWTRRSTSLTNRSRPLTTKRTSAFEIENRKSAHFARLSCLQPDVLGILAQHIEGTLHMKCHKCSKSAVVHLTEVVTDAAGIKRAMEIHL